MRGPLRSGGAAWVPLELTEETKHERRTKGPCNKGLSAYGSSRSQANLSIYLYVTKDLKIFSVISQSISTKKHIMFAHVFLTLERDLNPTGAVLKDGVQFGSFKK
jgi:hypothetical protein